MPLKPRPYLLVVGLLPALVALFATGPAFSASAGEATETPAFPVPVIAPVLDPDDLTASLSISSYGVTEDGDAVEVRFAKPFELPDVFRYRVELHIGDPEGQQQRISFVAEEGEQSGLIEEGDGDDWNEVGTVDTEFRDDGVIVIEVPSDLADDLDPEVAPLAWMEAELVRESSGGAERFVTPLVPALDVVAPDSALLAPAPVAWGSDDQPPDPPVPTGTAPTLRLEGGELIVEFSEPVPTDVDGAPVAAVKDVVRIAPDFAAQGAAPYLLVIDHAEDTVSLLDGSLALPAEVPNNGDWLLEGLPTRGVQEGDTIRASLEGILDVFGITSQDLANDDHIALGIARTVRVTDEADPEGSGTEVAADGVLATAEWLRATDRPAVTPSLTIGSGDPTAEESTRDKYFAPVVTVCVIALVATTIYLLVRWLDHRRRMRATGPIVDPRPAPAPTEEEREELEEFTREIFGGR